MLTYIEHIPSNFSSLRLNIFILSKNQRGLYCVSLTVGARALPFIDSRRCHAQCVSDLLLCEVVGFAVSADLFTNVHDDDLL